MKTTFEQKLVIFYWAILDIYKYSLYQHYLRSGLQPKYAFEKVDNL
jgi:hypothetical protein